MNRIVVIDLSSSLNIELNRYKILDKIYLVDDETINFFNNDILLGGNIVKECWVAHRDINPDVIIKHTIKNILIKKATQYGLLGDKIFFNNIIVGTELIYCIYRVIISSVGDINSLEDITINKDKKGFLLTIKSWREVDG